MIFPDFPVSRTRSRHCTLRVWYNMAGMLKSMFTAAGASSVALPPPPDRLETAVNAGDAQRSPPPLARPLPGLPACACALAAHALQRVVAVACADGRIVLRSGTGAALALPAPALPKPRDESAPRRVVFAPQATHVMTVIVGEALDVWSLREKCALVLDDKLANVLLTDETCRPTSACFVAESFVVIGTKMGNLIFARCDSTSSTVVHVGDMHDILGEGQEGGAVTATLALPCNESTASKRCHVVLGYEFGAVVVVDVLRRRRVGVRAAPFGTIRDACWAGHATLATDDHVLATSHDGGNVLLWHVKQPQDAAAVPTTTDAIQTPHASCLTPFRRLCCTDQGASISRVIGHVSDTADGVLRIWTLAKSTGDTLGGLSAFEVKHDRTTDVAGADDVDEDAWTLRPPDAPSRMYPPFGGELDACVGWKSSVAVLCEGGALASWSLDDGGEGVPVLDTSGVLDGSQPADMDDGGVSTVAVRLFVADGPGIRAITEPRLPGVEWQARAWIEPSATPEEDTASSSASSARPTSDVCYVQTFPSEAILVAGLGSGAAWFFRELVEGGDGDDGGGNDAEGDGLGPAFVPEVASPTHMAKRSSSGGWDAMLCVHSLHACPIVAADVAQNATAVVLCDKGGTVSVVDLLPEPMLRWVAQSELGGAGNGGRYGVAFAGDNRAGSDDNTTTTSSSTVVVCDPSATIVSLSASRGETEARMHPKATNEKTLALAALAIDGTPAAQSSGDAPLVLLVTDVATRVYPLPGVRRGDKTTLKKLASHSSEQYQAARVVSLSGAPGLVLVSTSGAVSLVSLPNLVAVRHLDASSWLRAPPSDLTTPRRILLTESGTALLAWDGSEAVLAHAAPSQAECSAATAATSIFDVDLARAIEAGEHEASRRRGLARQEAATVAEKERRKSQERPAPVRTGMLGGLGGLADKAKAAAAAAMEKARGGSPSAAKARAAAEREKEMESTPSLLEFFDPAAAANATASPSPTLARRELLTRTSSGGSASAASSSPRSPAARSVDDIKRAYGRPTTDANRAARAASDAMHENRRKLEERGEKLEELADKTAQLENEAADFASAARKLREQQERWF